MHPKSAQTHHGGQVYIIVSPSLVAQLYEGGQKTLGHLRDIFCVYLQGLFYHVLHPIPSRVLNFASLNT